MKFTHILLLASAAILARQTTQALSANDIDHYMNVMNNVQVLANKDGEIEIDSDKIKDKAKKEMSKAKKKLLEHEHKRFIEMDLDEDGQVCRDEFIVYWRQYCKDNYGYYDESADDFYNKAFDNIAEGKESFDWPTYKKFLTEVKVETVEDEDEKMLFF